MTTAEILQEVFRLNNEGAALLCSHNLQNTQLAIEHFNQALHIATAFEPNDKTTDCLMSQLRTAADAGIRDLCLYSSVPDLKTDEDSFYFFDKAIFLMPEVFVQYMGGNAQKTLEFISAMVTMNTALGCYQLGYACLGQREAEKANSFFHKSLHLYGHVVAFLSEYDPYVNGNTKAVLFFVLAAQNNYSWLCLKLGLMSACRRVQNHMVPLLEQGAELLPMDAMPFVDEIFLNTTVLDMSNVFTSLPAPAA